MTPALFEERQRPPRALTIAGLTVVAVAVAFALYASSRLDRMMWELFLVPVFAGVVNGLIRMTTYVAPDRLRVTIVPFPRKSWPVSEIASCEAVTYRPLVHYGGWGWKWSLRRGPAYTMRGNRGVMVRRTNGKQFLIGSQRPEELAAAIRSVTQGPRSGA